jgi:putative transposase
LREALLELARQKPRYGYRRLWVLLRERQGWKVSIGRVHRLYKKEGLMVRRLKRKRLKNPVPQDPLLVRRNQEWGLDFVSDALANGRPLRVFTCVDGFTRESPVVEADVGISSYQLTRALDHAIEERGAPESVRTDNGPEFTSRHFIQWCEQRKIRMILIQPGKPVQNGLIESFNGRLRDECLNANWFVNLGDARQKIEAWRREYNSERPHSSLAYRTPEEFGKRFNSELTSRMAAIPSARPST